MSTLYFEEIEEGDERSVLQPEEEVRVRAVLARARHDIALDDVVQGQAEDVLVEAARFLGVAGTVGHVVQRFDFWHSTISLCCPAHARPDL